MSHPNQVSADPFQYYGIKKFATVSTEVEAHAEEVAIAGFTVLPDVISSSELEEIRRRLDAVYDRQVAEIGGAENLRKINDEFIVRLPLAYDELFVHLTVQPRVMAVVKLVLDDFFILSQQNGIVLRPTNENYQISWHRDLMYQHFTSSRPMGVSALFCIDDFTPETGATFMLPGSHRHEPFPSERYCRSHEVQAVAPAGSVLLFDSMLFHRAGINRSTRIRRGLNHYYTLPFMKQQMDIPTVLKGKYADDPQLAAVLGYTSRSGTDVVEWRQTRLKRGANG